MWLISHQNNVLSKLFATILFYYDFTAISYENLPLCSTEKNNGIYFLNEGE